MRKGWGWVYDPQSGGIKLSENNKWMFRQQAEKFAKDRRVPPEAGTINTSEFPI